MKKLIAGFTIFCIWLGVLGGALANSPETLPASDTPTIFLAGDSTCQSYGTNRAPLAGWGQALGSLLPRNISVSNHAESGRSSKSFIDDGRLDKIFEEMIEGDYLVIQFGHNDQSANPSKFTNPEGSYKAYLKQYIDGTRSRGGIPILATPIERRRFEGGKIATSLENQTVAMRDVAKDENVTLIDLNAETIRYYNFLGEEGSKSIFLYLEPGESPNYPQGITDNTHLNENGAQQISKIFLAELAKTQLPIAKFITGISSPVPPISSPKEDEETVTDDIETDIEEDLTAGYLRAAQELFDLGILQGNPNTGLDEGSILTRAEYVTILVRAFGLGETHSATGFSDVPSGHWAAKNIATAVKNKLISGKGDGAFGPEDPVTYEQAVKILMEAMYYGQESQSYAPYPWGYLVVAANRGITNNSGGHIEEEITRGQAAVMISNSLYIPMGNGEILADKSGGKTFFVSPTGSDENDGSYERPWQSVDKVISTIQAGQTAVFERGQYNISKHLKLASIGTEGKFTSLRSRDFEGTEFIFTNDNAFIEIPMDYVKLEGFNLTSEGMGGKILSVSGDYVVISDNTFVNDGDFAIYSEHTKGLKIEGNNFINSGIYLEGISDAIIQKNIIEQAAAGGIKIEKGGKNLQIYSNHISSFSTPAVSGISLGAVNSVLMNNIVISREDGLIRAGFEFSETNQCHSYNNIIVGAEFGVFFKGRNTDTVFKNNIISECVESAYSYENRPENLLSDYNLFYKSFPYKFEKNSIYEDPAFGDKYEDVKIRRDSLAIGAGIAVPSEILGTDGEKILLDLRDFAGQERTTWNIGAFNQLSDAPIPEKTTVVSYVGLLLSEAFNEDKNEWVINTGKWEIEKGICKQVDPGAGRSIIGYVSGHDWADYELSVKVKAPPSTRESTTGIIFRADEEMKNMYFFRIYENSQLEFGRWMNGQFVSIEKWDYKTNANEVYTLKARAVGNKISLYVDDEVVKEVTDNSYAKGSVGLYAFKQVGEFDDVKVTGITN